MGKQYFTFPDADNIVEFRKLGGISFQGGIK